MRKGDGMIDDIFPKIKKDISQLIEDEEGNIPGNKLLMLGTMVMILGSMFATDVFGAHRSHSSHKSHRSSGSHGNSSNHHSHVSHQSHQSSTSTHSNHGSHSSHNNTHSNHSNHASHSSHSNTSAHSNSKYSGEGDVSYAPAASKIKGISVPPVTKTEDLFKLPELNQDINENIEVPNGTPGTGILPNIAVPASTVNVKIDAGDIKIPSQTDIVK